MFKHLLVPLDGSKLAEASLPGARYFAAIMGAKVTLIHMVEKDAPREIHGERHLTGEQEARNYLAEVAARVFPPPIKVEVYVHGEQIEDVARSIAQHTAQLSADLIVMCTHGRGGLRGFMYGRIAQQVSGLSITPILLIPPGASTGFSCKRILTPLDGNPDHEEGLKIAANLAGPCGAKIHLIMAVHTYTTLSGESAATAKMLPGTTRAILDLVEKDAEKYLLKSIESFRTRGIAVDASVGRGEPVAVIVDCLKKTGADLLVMATHGKTGMDAFWSGSTTPNLSARATVPLLLVPVRDKKE